MGWGGEKSNSTKEAVCHSSWPTRTTSARSQWWCSNLTDWAQRFVCLKPLTYFYSHCRSQSLYGMIAELMQLVYSNNSMKKKKKKKNNNWPKERRLIKCLSHYTHSWRYTKHLWHAYLQKTESIRVMCHRIPRKKKPGAMVVVVYFKNPPSWAFLWGKFGSMVPQNKTLIPAGKARA